MIAWKLSERRVRQVRQYLAVQADTESVPAGGPARSRADRERALALSLAGQQALGFVLEAACSNPAARPTTELRAAWRTMTAASGARASVLLAHGLAATTECLAQARGHHTDAQRQRDARELLRACTPWTPFEQQAVDHAAALIDPATAAGLPQARRRLALAAASQVVGPGALRLPGLDPATPPHQTSAAWERCWTQAMDAWLDASDPEGLTRPGDHSP